jgi:hypothetical protein
VQYDTYLNAWSKNKNYNQDATLHLRDYTASSLFKFDISAITDVTSVHTATLSIYLQSASNELPTYIELYQMLRTWDSAQATWIKSDAVSSSTWNAPGAQGTDHASEPSDVAYVPTKNHWVTLDVTEIVKQWVADPAVNYGLILEATSRFPVDYALPARESRNRISYTRLVIR